MTRHLVALAAALTACGPSSGEIKQAQSARYTCEYETIAQAIVDVVKEETPPVGVSDPDRGVFASDFRWHSSSGMRKEPGAAQLGQGDLGFVVEVYVGKDEVGYQIRTKPRVFSQAPDTPHGREMSHEDANWPGWADAKAEKVQIGIHQKLSSCAARGA